MAYLSERQCHNRWKKRTYDCDISEYFNRAPKKLKERVKHFIVKCGYTKETGFLSSAIYECYHVNVSPKLCNDLIDHYTKGNENDK